jgi:hypothetical protein
MKGWRQSPQRRRREFVSALRSQFNAHNADSKQPSRFTLRKVVRFIVVHAFLPDALRKQTTQPTLEPVNFADQGFPSLTYLAEPSPSRSLTFLLHDLSFALLSYGSSIYLDLRFQWYNLDCGITDFIKESVDN